MKITFSKAIKGVRYLKHYGWKEFWIRLQEKMEAEQVPYEPWYERHAVKEEELKRQRKQAAGWKDAPKISIVVPLYRTPERFLLEMVQSVQAQSYENWQLCLADGSGYGTEKGEQPVDLEKLLQPQLSADARIVYKKLPENLGIAGNTNAAIAMADGAWIAFLDHDDLLAPDALYEAVCLMRGEKKQKSEPSATGFLAHQGEKQTETASYDVIYTDEDKVDMEGKKHFQPHLKPDINIDLLRSNNYITHFLLVKREIVEQVGGIRSEYDGAQDYDFILRCCERAEHVGHVPRILYHWRCHEASTSDNPFSKQYAVDAGRRAIADHLARMGVKGTVEPTKDMGFYAVHYELEGEPLVSIIIPSRDEVDSLKKCIASIEKSEYKKYEIIIVENNSTEETFAYYKTIAPEETEGVQYVDSQTGEKMTPKTREGRLSGGQRICVAIWQNGFNYAKLNNFGAKQAEGEYFVLLNNDVEVINPSWLTEMLGTCQRKETGIVGAKLYYPDNTIQHAGIAVGIGGSARGIADNLFVGMSGERSGYLHKASLQLDYSAVTAACMMVKRSVYELVGGFTEELSVAFNDVDFCLKARSLGYLVVYHPRVEAYHYESKSRGAEDSKEKVARFQREIEYMRNHWISILRNGDPYYNVNLSSVYNNYSLKDNS